MFKRGHPNHFTSGTGGKVRLGERPISSLSSLVGGIHASTPSHMNEQDLVLVERTYHEGKVWVVRLNRPKSRNAVDGVTAKLLANAFLEFEHDHKACVAVLYGMGGNFCAGADLKAVSEAMNENSKSNPLSSVPKVEPVNGAILDGSGPMGASRLLLSKPVIAAVSGYAVAGGLELACWADLRVVDETAVFGVFCRRFGVPLIDGGTVRLPLLIGASRAMDMILTGRAVGAQEALSFGLANRLVSSTTKLESSSNDSNPEVLKEAIKLASEISDFPQGCMRSDRLSVYNTVGTALRQALAIEFEIGVAAVQKEGVEGAKKFTQGAGRHGTPRAKL
jgi:enoyl-CoA hydratase